MRVVARHWPKDLRWNVLEASETRLSDVSTYVEFARRLNDLRKQIRDYIEDQELKGKSVWCYGASTRGNTLLQWLGFDDNTIYKIADRNPAKWGKFTAGGNIPIVSEEEMRAVQPDNLLVLPYHFWLEFIAREQEYLKKGGKMIFPLPEFKILDKPLPPGPD